MSTINYTQPTPCHDIPQAYRRSKSVCTVWIRPKENLQSHPRTSISINEILFNQCEQTIQQPMTIRSKTKLQRIVVLNMVKDKNLLEAVIFEYNSGPFIALWIKYIDVWIENNELKKLVQYINKYLKDFIQYYCIQKLFFYIETILSWR